MTSGRIKVNAGKLLRTASGKVATGDACCCSQAGEPCDVCSFTPAAIEITLTGVSATTGCCTYQQIGDDWYFKWKTPLSIDINDTFIVEQDTSDDNCTWAGEVEATGELEFFYTGDCSGSPFATATVTAVGFYYHITGGDNFFDVFLRTSSVVPSLGVFHDEPSTGEECFPSSFTNTADCDFGAAFTGGTASVDY